MSELYSLCIKFYVNVTAFTAYGSLDQSLKHLSSSVIGDDSILFGDKSFPDGQCYNESTAFAGHPNRIDLVIAIDESGSGRSI